MHNLYQTITAEIDQLPKSPKIGAFFDFDKTVINGFSAFAFMREQVKQGYIKPAELMRLIQTMTSFGMGDIDFSAFMAVSSQFQKGYEEKALIDFGNEIFDKHISKLIYPEAKALIDAHLKKGHRVALISSATRYQVEPAAKLLGIEHYCYTALEMEDGVLTGNVVHPTCYGYGKVIAAKKLQSELGLDLDASYFYTDSDEDIELLDVVGNPRPTNPNERLSQVAIDRNWPISNFHTRKRASIRGFLRTAASQVSLLTSFAAGLSMYAMTGSKRTSRNFAISLYADTAMALMGISLKINGEEHVWSSRPAVFMFNHQSQADVGIMASLLRRDLAGVAKKELKKIPVLGSALEFGGTVYVDRTNNQSAIEALAPLLDAIKKEQRSVVIAPEGTRSMTTDLAPFKKGGFHIAMKAGVPIVPVVIHNAIEACPRGQYIVNPAVIYVDVLPPISTEEWTPETIDEHVAFVRGQFLDTLGKDHLISQNAPKLVNKTKPKIKTANIKAATASTKAKKSTAKALKKSARI